MMEGEGTSSSARLDAEKQVDVKPKDNSEALENMQSEIFQEHQSDLELPVEDIGKGARKKVPTHKGKQYQAEQLHKKSKLAFNAFSKSITELISVMSKRELHIWKTKKNEAEQNLASLTSAHQQLIGSLDDFDEIQAENLKYMKAVDYYGQIMTSVTKSIKNLEVEESDAISIGGSASGFSKRSSSSRS